RNLAAVYDGRDQVPLSIQHLQKALSVQPQDPEGWVNLSSLRRRVKDYPGAVEAAERAVRMKPNNPNAHGNLGLSLLAMGDYDRGFSEYEWRWRCDNFTSPQRDFSQPMWDGSDPTGRRIFVHSEQGYGDTIQFARFIPMLAARGATVYLEAVTYIKPLLATLQGVTRVVTAGTRPPEYDLQIPLLSLPRIFKTNAANIPNDVPYLRSDSERLARWKQQIDSIGPGMKVGLIWAGNVKPDASRTCPLQNFAPLAELNDIRFVGLQKRDNPSGAETPPAGMDFTDMSADLKDFAETAAAMMNLDLIVTIDTSSAHLAGALGRPTWTLLPWAADWRWLSDREDSPWYPTMRLFRQQTKGDWQPVIERIAQELGKARDSRV
ncbi:MAG TPA: tetratricopeptide repeat protein, partial [Tepidisphaeraceae bacterium]|nr:tetratricopeptide repeat protein [Tepidisphaeraceae bacterium]